MRSLSKQPAILGRIAIPGLAFVGGLCIFGPAQHAAATGLGQGAAALIEISNDTLVTEVRRGGGGRAGGARVARGGGARAGRGVAWRGGGYRGGVYRPGVGWGAAAGAAAIGAAATGAYYSGYGYGYPGYGYGGYGYSTGYQCGYAPYPPCQ